MTGFVLQGHIYKADFDFDILWWKLDSINFSQKSEELYIVLKNNLK